MIDYFALLDQPRTPWLDLDKLKDTFHRKSLEKPELATPGEIYRVTVDAGVTGNVFLKGHRIRLEISSSNFPRFDRNSNTGTAVEQAPKLVKASQTVYHDIAHPSCLVLMVIPSKT